MVSTMTENNVVDNTCAMNEKENVLDHSPRLKRRCLPLLKPQSKSSSKASQGPGICQAIAQRSLRDTTNLKKPKQGHLNHTEKFLLFDLPEVSEMADVAMTDKTWQSPSDMADALPDKNNHLHDLCGESEGAVQERYKGGECPDICISSNNKYRKYSLTDIGATGAETGFFSQNSTFHFSTPSWGNLKGPFFPPIHGRLEVESRANGQYLPSDDRSHQSTVFRCKWRAPEQQGNSGATNMSSALSSFRRMCLGSKNKCLTPVPEMSPVRNSGVHEERDEGEVSARGGMNSPAIFIIEAHTLPNWDIDYTVEESCMKGEESAFDLPSAVLVLPQVEQEERTMMPEVEKEERTELARGCDNCISTIAKKGQVTKLLEKTQPVNSTSSNSGARLGATYFLSVAHMNSEGHTSLETGSKIMDEDECRMGMNPKEEPPVKEIFSRTYVLSENTAQPVLNVTVELAEQGPAVCCIQAGMKGVGPIGDDAYELQSVQGEESVTDSQDGEKCSGKSTPGFSRNGGFYGNASMHSVDEGASMSSLDESLAVKVTGLVTSPLLTVSKVFNFPEQLDTSAIHAEEELLEVTNLVHPREIKASGVQTLGRMQHITGVKRYSVQPPIQGKKQVLSGMDEHMRKRPGCGKCVQYQKEIERLLAARGRDQQEIEGLREEIQKLTAGLE